MAVKKYSEQPYRTGKTKPLPGVTATERKYNNSAPARAYPSRSSNAKSEQIGRNAATAAMFIPGLGMALRTGVAAARVGKGVADNVARSNAKGKGTGSRPSGGTAKAKATPGRPDRPPGGRVIKDPVDIVGRTVPRPGAARGAVTSGKSGAVARTTPGSRAGNAGAQRAIGSGKGSSATPAKSRGGPRQTIPVVAGALVAGTAGKSGNKGTPMRPVPKGGKGTPMRPVPGKGTPMRPVPSASKPDKPKADKPKPPSSGGSGGGGKGKPAPKGRIVSQSDTKFVPGIGVVLKSAPNKKYTGRIKMVVAGTTRAKDGIADYSKGRNTRGYSKNQLQPVNKGSLNGPYAKPKAKPKAK